MILCAGESLIDMVPQDGVFRPLPGGAVYNTTIALGRLGVPTSYLWPISTDVFGDQIIKPLKESGVETGLCPRTDRLTTLAVVTLNDDGDARYSFYDEGSAGRMFAPDDIGPLPDQVQALFVGGISLVPDPCGATIEALVAAHKDQLAVMIDPNIRPFFIRDASAYRARLSRLFAMAQIVKLSADDLTWLFPGLAPEDGLRRILDLGPRIVVLTEGAQGVRAYWSGRTIQSPAIPVPVADTIGAGDTFNAGLLASLARQGVLSLKGLAEMTPDNLAKALKVGTQAASVTVSRHGANPPWAHELAV